MSLKGQAGKTSIMSMVKGARTPVVMMSRGAETAVVVINRGAETAAMMTRGAKMIAVAMKRECHITRTTLLSGGCRKGRVMMATLIQ